MWIELFSANKKALIVPQLFYDAVYKPIVEGIKVEKNGNLMCEEGDIKEVAARHLYLGWRMHELISRSQVLKGFRERIRDGMEKKEREIY